MGRASPDVLTLDDFKMAGLSPEQLDAVIRAARQYGCLRGSTEVDINEYKRRLRQQTDLLLQARPQTASVQPGALGPTNTTN